MTAKSYQVSRRELDSGLQPERTSLAWIRTLFLVFGNGLLLLRVGSTEPNWFIFLLGCLMIFLTIVLYAYVVFRSNNMKLDVELTSTRTVITHRATTTVLAIVCFSSTLYFLCKIFLA